MYWSNYSSVDEFVLLGLTNNRPTQLVLFAVFFKCYLTTLVGNFLIILVTKTEISLQTPMYFFLSNLSFIDISYSSTVVPKMLKDLASRKKNILLMECACQMYFGLSLAYAECILLPIMAYDRYIAICYPLRYTAIMSRLICVRLAAATWIFGFLLSLVMVTILFNLPMCGQREINHFVCEPPAVLTLVCIDLFIINYTNFVLSIIFLLTPITCILLSYLRIITAILKITSAAARQKTFYTCASHMIVVTLFYSMIMATYTKPTSVYSQEHDKIIAIIYTVLTPMFNPLIYTLRNKEVIVALNNFINRNNLFFSKAAV